MPFRPLAAAVLGAVVLAPAAGAQTLEDVALQRRLPTALQTTCTVIPPEGRTPDSLAGFRCAPEATGGVDARFDAFPSHAAAGNRYRTLLLPSPVGLRQYFGDCPAGGPAETEALMNDYPSGRLACFSDLSGVATIVWTNTPSGIVGVATRTDGDFASLWRWWTTAGPNGSTVDSRLLAVGGLYPDPYEVGMMHEMAPEVAQACTRERLPRTRRLLQASLLCGGVPGPRATVIYRRFATKALAERQYARDLALTGIAREADGSCTANPPWETFWTRNGRARGRLACGIFRGAARVFWYDRDLRMEAYATRRDRNLRALHRWWQRRG
ncbi:MAG: hypothetical protein U0237_11110 [Thermoleophilia bacterium]